MPPVPLPEGEDEFNDPSAYTGSWKYKAIDITNGKLSIQGQDFGTFDGFGKEIFGFFTITENPNKFRSDISYTAVLNLNLFNQTQTTDFPIDKRTMGGTWTESNDVITFTLNDGSSMKVESSSTEQIVFTGQFMEKIALGQQFTFDADADITYTLER